MRRQLGSLALLLLLPMIDGVGSPAFFTHPSPQSVPVIFDHAVAWQNPSAPIPCPPASAQALRQNAPSNDCQTWFIMVPATEGGNPSTEVRFAESGQTTHVGVFMDDYSRGGPEYFAAYQNLRAAGVHVCPVLYADEGSPFGNLVPCLLLVIPPYLIVNGTVSDWKTATLKAESRFDATSLMLLLYFVPYSHWRQPIPSAYVTGVESAAHMMNQTLVVFN